MFVKFKPLLETMQLGSPPQFPNVKGKGVKELLYSMEKIEDLSSGLFHNTSIVLQDITFLCRFVTFSGGFFSKGLYIVK